MILWQTNLTVSPSAGKRIDRFRQRFLKRNVTSVEKRISKEKFLSGENIETEAQRE